MNHQYRRERALSRRLHQVTPHLSRIAAGRWVVHVLRLDPRIGEGDGLRLRVARQERLRHGQAARHQRAGPQQELAAVDAAVAVLVVEIEYALVDVQLRRRFSHRWTSPCRRLIRFSGANPGVGTAIALPPRAILRRHRLAVKKRAVQVYSQYPYCVPQRRFLRGGP